MDVKTVECFVKFGKSGLETAASKHHNRRNTMNFNRNRKPQPPFPQHNFAISAQHFHNFHTIFSPFLHIIFAVSAPYFRRNAHRKPPEKQVKSRDRSLKAAYPGWETVDLCFDLQKWCPEMRELCLDLPKLCGEVGKFGFEIWGLST